MKDKIVKFLKWALSKFEDTTPQTWPFPVEETPKKTKPRVKKATTRPSKKSPAAIRTTAKKTAKAK